MFLKSMLIVYCLLSLQQLRHSAVFLHEATFSNLAGGAVLWNGALTFVLWKGRWLKGASLGCLSCGSEPGVLF